MLWKLIPCGTLTGVTSAVFGTLFLLFLLSFLWILWRFCTGEGSGDIEAFGNMPHSYENHPTTLYTLEELERATRNFSDDMKLGSGGFGTVYKGTLDNGVKVAVKRTNRCVETKGIKEQFMNNEVTLLSQVNHRNLVRLHGCLRWRFQCLCSSMSRMGICFSTCKGDDLSRSNWAGRRDCRLQSTQPKPSG
jgi:hypothetical protein